ncbi:MAG: repressor LexA [Gemmatimonadetes bacterium]|nr:repressor LexA [Gemmatimonadota bacterium]
MKKLSERQRTILDFIEKFIEDRGYPPSVRDIQQGCDISSTSVVAYNLEILKKHGHIRRDAEVSRGLELVGGPARRPRQEMVAIPLMGTVAAGAPFPLPTAESWTEEAIETIELPQAIVGRGDNVYALRVRGDSMIDALIGDGDLVIMEDTRRVENGQMAAVRLKLEEETTLKRFYAEGPTVRLQPANAQMVPLRVPADNVEVLSRVLAVWRFPA